MNISIEQTSGWRRNRWRIIGWGFAVALILTPLIAMRFTSEVNWTASDFVFAIIMFGGVGLLFELAARMSRNSFYRAGVALALLGCFLLIWVNAAVGIIDGEDNPANLLFGVVVLIAILGSALARFRSSGMALAMFAAVAAQIVIAIGALIGGNNPYGSLLITGFAIPFLLSGLLLKYAAKQQDLARA